MPSKYYAVTRQLNPSTGDLLMTGADFAEGSPAAEVVLFVLRTPLGTFLPDPTVGVDSDMLRKLNAQTRSKWMATVKAGLKRHVDNGTIANLVVEVDPPANGRLYYQVTFTDPRTGNSITLAGPTH